MNILEKNIVSMAENHFHMLEWEISEKNIGGAFSQHSIIESYASLVHQEDSGLSGAAQTRLESLRSNSLALINKLRDYD